MRKKATLLLLGILTITLLLLTGCSERKDYSTTVSVLGHLEEGKYTGKIKNGLAERLLPIRKHREERENGIASAVPFSHFSIDAVTFDISKAPMPL